METSKTKQNKGEDKDKEIMYLKAKIAVLERNASVKESEDDKYYNPELFRAEVDRLVEEKRSNNASGEVTRAEVEAIIEDLMKNGLKRPEVKEE